jgi:Tol biopolymer transport system component
MYWRTPMLRLRFVVVAMAACTIVPVSAQRSGQRDILFDSRQEGSEIWAIRPDGSGLRRLTHSPKNTSNQVPRWSPDRRRIAFGSTRYGPSPKNQNREIYVMNRDGSVLQRLTYGPKASDSPDWSPDGKRIAFDSNRDGNWKSYVMDANGTNVRRLTTDQMTPPAKGESGPAWSPDGKQIAFTSDRDGEDFEIYILELETSKLTRLTDNNAHDSHVAWSPDGRFLSFDSTRDGDSEIYLMCPDGSQVRRLTNHPRMDNAARWSRDGQKLAFNSTRDSNSDDLAKMELYVMNRDGSGVRRLTNNSVKDTHPDW